MASTKKLLTKDERVYYGINVSRGRGKSRLTRRWYVPDGWSRKAIERELATVAAEFERQCDAGEVMSKATAKQNRRSGPPRKQRRPQRYSPSGSTANGSSCPPKPSP